MSVITRMGDGSTVEMTRDELRADILEGSEVAATKAKIPTLMRTVREELVGVVTGTPSLAKGLAAKARIEALLDVRVNSIEQLKKKMDGVQAGVR